MFVKLRYFIKPITMHLVLSLVVIPLTTMAQTVISDDIQNVTFSPAGNPWIVEKDLVVPAGKKVVIPAGCVFLFQPFSGIVVHGQLIVQGTEEKTVVFSTINDAEYNSASNQFPNPFDWNGIYCRPESRGSHFNNFILRYSVYGIKSENRNIVIQNGLFQQNGQFHVTVDNEIQFVQDKIPFTYKPDGDPTPSTKESSGSGLSSEAPPDPGQRRTRLLNIAAATLAAAGIGTAAAGVYFVLEMNDEEEAIENNPSMKESEYNRRLESWETAKSRTTLSFIASGVCVPVSAIMFIVNNRKQKKTGTEPRVRLEAGVMPSFAGGSTFAVGLSALF